MLVFIFITILLLVVSILPIKIKMKSHVDFFDNDGYIKVYFFSLRVFKGGIYFEQDSEDYNSLVVKHGKKANSIHLNNDYNDKKSIVKIMKNPAFKNIMIKKVSAHVSVGKNDNAFFTVMLLGSVRAFMLSTFALLKSRYKTTTEQSFTPIFNQNKLDADFEGIISVSIANIISGLLLNKSPTKKQKEKEVMSKS